ncbi:MAG: TRAP transporter small permease [Oceanospirillales bacterium]|uniref:TRAP transporter small permease protein n=1 Tax=Marinobacterium halophilum TaxID=267374 RepID=A0A2P8ETY7_9GAMM|nr:TRAP transporter small permease [Marinobacterium halophilum]MBR9830325.1 TRAP transporter small permease [Oceanospirillales bacterium]PSL12905.1 TRAP-type C4-dicarboxylate transport system permease small subunit [Marinobacterium halophilum]
MNSTLNPAVSWVHRGERAVQHLLSGTAAIVMFLMMALTLVDVLGRYLFSAPVTGAFELTELMLAAVIFLGLPLITAENGHVAVDIMDSAFGPRAQVVQEWLIALVNILAFAIFSWMLWKHAFKVYRYEDTTAVLQIPYAWLGFLMAGTTSLATLTLCLQLLFKRTDKTSGGKQ